MLKKSFCAFFFTIFSVTSAFSLGYGGFVAAKLLTSQNEGFENMMKNLGVTYGSLVDFNFIRFAVQIDSTTSLTPRAFAAATDCFWLRIHIADISDAPEFLDDFSFPECELYFRLGFGFGMSADLADSSKSDTFFRIPFYPGLLFADKFSVYLMIAPAFSPKKMNLSGTEVSLCFIWWYG